MAMTVRIARSSKALLLWIRRRLRRIVTGIEKQWCRVVSNRDFSTKMVLKRCIDRAIFDES
jgi:hypothetical protein